MFKIAKETKPNKGLSVCLHPWQILKRPSAPRLILLMNFTACFARTKVSVHPSKRAASVPLQSVPGGGTNWSMRQVLQLRWRLLLLALHVGKDIWFSTEWKIRLALVRTSIQSTISFKAFDRTRFICKCSRCDCPLYNRGRFCGRTCLALSNWGVWEQRFKERTNMVTASTRDVMLQKTFCKSNFSVGDAITRFWPSRWEQSCPWCWLSQPWHRSHVSPQQYVLKYLCIRHD